MSTLRYKLSAQLVAHLRTYLPDEETVERVLQYHGKDLAQLIHARMQAHAWTNVTNYEVRVAAGFDTLRENSYMHDADKPGRPFRDTVDDRGKIRRLIVAGFRKCLYATQKFDSDTERRFAVLLEDDSAVLKWFKPTPGQFQIYYKNTRNYAPDFVVETDTAIFMCETKRSDQADSPEVKAKEQAAKRYCEQASAHSRRHDGKPWSYVLIPHVLVSSNATLQGIAERV
jgi:type III restriction enzyme